MPTYPWSCEKCDIEFDTVEKMSEYSGKADCPGCSNPATRIWTTPQILGASVESPDYNPGLGCVVKNKRHREQIAKSRGLEEVGSEPTDKIHKHFDSQRAEKSRKRWERE